MFLILISNSLGLIADIYLMQVSKCPQVDTLNVELYPEEKSAQKLRPCMACTETRTARRACLKDQVIE